jgi:ferredoxin
VRRAPTVALRLRIDPVACEAVGRCAQVADRVVELDRWGYPILAADLGPGDVSAARRAVRACPRRALWLEEIPERD